MRVLNNNLIYLEACKYKVFFKALINEHTSIFDINICLNWQDRIGFLARYNKGKNVRLDVNFIFIDARMSIGLRHTSLIYDINCMYSNTFGVYWIFNKYNGIGYIRGMFLTKRIHAI